VRGENNIFMFVNEDFEKRGSTSVKLPCTGNYARLDLLSDISAAGYSKEGRLELDLLPNQSQIVIFGDIPSLPEEICFSERIPLSPSFELELAECDDLTNYKTCGHFNSFFNINSPDFRIDFSGKMRYTFTFDIAKDERRTFLDLGKVGQNAELYINQKKCGIRISAPYLFEITDAIEDGQNEAVVIVSNTLAQKVRDKFSYFLQLAPSGLLGDMCIKR